MNKVINLLIVCFFSFGINNIYAETQTATFDFSTNSYTFPECTSISDLITKRIDANTEIENNGVTLTLSADPFGNADKYSTNWYRPYQALYCHYKSFFYITLNQSDTNFKTVTMTFANGMNGKECYFYGSIQKDAVGTYTLNDDIGVLEFGDSKYTTICWWCSIDNSIQIKKINVEYNILNPTGSINSISEGVRISTTDGFIRINGNYKCLDVYNISGLLISHNKREIKCSPGIYIVRVDGNAQKVIVR